MVCYVTDTNVLIAERKILLVEDSIDDADLLRQMLNKYHCGSFKVSHKQSMAEAEKCMEEHAGEIALILLDLGLPDTANSRDSFERMKQSAAGIPIIILTDMEDDKLALTLVAEGAADLVNKRLLQQRPESLRSVIEFSLARDIISKKAAQKNATNLISIRDQSADEIRRMKEHEEIALKEAVKRGNDDLREASRCAADTLQETKTEAAAAFKEFQDASAERHREKDQIIHWMGGGYSMEKTSEANS